MYGLRGLGFILLMIVKILHEPVYDTTEVEGTKDPAGFLISTIDAIEPKMTPKTLNHKD